MSYSTSYPCGICKYVDTCIDRHVVLGAVNVIHAIGRDWNISPEQTTGKGHFGGGNIDIACSNFVAKE